MKVIKAFFIAFSMYSKIPVPQFEWKEEDMKYVLCFFPWVGAVIGGLIYLWSLFCQKHEVGALCYTMIGTAIPLLVTGGFHVDGFMDTMDAFRSYQPKEKKLEILKDSHIGAFAAIMLATLGLVWLGAFSEVSQGALLRIICAGFFLARCLSGQCSILSFCQKRRTAVLVCQPGRKKNCKRLLVPAGDSLHRFYDFPVSHSRRYHSIYSTVCFGLLLLSKQEGAGRRYRRYLRVFSGALRGKYDRSGSSSVPVTIKKRVKENEIDNRRICPGKIAVCTEEI